jgi:2-oxoglutarate ferredoxin oxidoreductase subunit beta
MNEINDTSLHTPNFPTWCPGCGDFGIWGAIKMALAELAIPEEQLVIVFDIGCSGNMADFLRVYGFHALHGRSVPIAEGIKMANHGLKVLVIGGDGGIYGEGMGHFIASCRGNHNITLLVHNNQTYGLTKGQSSPTTTKGVKTSSTPQGLIENPVNPVALALSADATWIGKSYAGDIQFTKNMLKKAMAHPGFSLLDVYQPCVTYNKLNTHLWFQERVYKLDETYQPNDKVKAWQLAMQFDKLPIGLFYEDVNMPAYHQQVPLLAVKSLVQQFPAEVTLKATLDALS